MPAEPPPNTHHIRGHVQLLSTQCQNLDLENQRLDRQAQKMGEEEGGAAAGQKNVEMLYSQGLPNRARSQETKLIRYMELKASKLQTMRQRREVELALIQA